MKQILTNGWRWTSGNFGELFALSWTCHAEWACSTPSSAHSRPLLSKLTFQTSGFLQRWLSELGLLLTRHLWGPHSRIDRSLLKHSWLGLDQRCPWKLKISGSRGWAQSCPYHYQSRSPAFYPAHMLHPKLLSAPFLGPHVPCWCSQPLHSTPFKNVLCYYFH